MSYRCDHSFVLIGGRAAILNLTIVNQLFMRKRLIPLCCIATAMSLNGTVPVARVASPESGHDSVGREDCSLHTRFPGRAVSTPGDAERIGENNPLVPPFCETLDNFRQGMEHDDFPRYFQVIDANGDGRSWGLYNYTGDRPYGRCAYMLFPNADNITGADDWLVTRAITLEAGKYYRISLDASLYMDDDANEGPQTFEVRCGMYNDPEGMNTVVIPARSVDSSRFTKFDGWFVPRLSGTYYIGIHGISPKLDPYYNYLFVDNIAVDAPREQTVPGSVTDIAMTNDPDGSTRVDIAFNAPAVDIAGNSLSGNVSVKVFRDGTEIHTFESVSPSETCTLSDTPDSEGVYTWAFRAYNSSGEGADTFHTRFAGIAAPEAPLIVNVAETAGHNVTYRWTRPGADINGAPLNDSMVRFNIYDISDGYPLPVATDIDADEYTIQMPAAQYEQVYATFALSATFNGKESEKIAGDMIPVGPPYTLPFCNSFTMDEYYLYLLSVENKQDATWRFLDDHSFPHAQDNDNGYIAMICNIPDETCELQTGKISLEGSTAPLLSFYTYVYDMDENEINIKVRDCDTGEKVIVRTAMLGEYTRSGWNKVVCPLGDFAGKTVQIGLEGVIRTHGYIPVDNMRIEQMPPVDLSVGEVFYPRGMKPGETFDIEATVWNWGTVSTDNYSVSLLCDGNVVGTADGTSVGSLSHETVTLSARLEAFSSPRSTYTVMVSADGDNHPEDNISDPFVIDMIVPTFPPVTDLTCSGSGEQVRLEWTAPDISSAGPEPITEDFESYPAFDTWLGGKWLMADIDGGYVGGFNGIEMPVDGTQQAWWVMDSSSPFEFISPYSGSKALVQMYGLNEYADSEIACDDWLISPELYGGCQTVSFMASSLTGDYGYETMEVYISGGSTDPRDFVLHMEECEVPDNWMEYYVYIPAGTRRFAIRATTPAGYMLKLDDITYVPTGTPVKLSLKGYNVYRNGELQNTLPLTATSFDTSQTGENDGYYVTAVYDKGESVASNIVGFGNNGISVPAAEDNGAPEEYYNLQGMRVGQSDLLPGIYLRRRGTVTDKILIRR